MCPTYNSEEELVVPIKSGSLNDDSSEVQSTRYYSRVVVRYDSVGRLPHFGDNCLTLRPIMLCTGIIGAILRALEEVGNATESKCILFWK